jgi:hypothetical protein
MVVNLKLVGYISKRVVRMGWLFIGLVAVQLVMSLSGTIPGAVTGANMTGANMTGANRAGANRAGANRAGGGVTRPQSAIVSKSATIPPLLSQPAAVQPHSVD